MRTLLRYILACARSFLVAIFTGAVITVFANTVTLGWELTQEYPMMILMIPLAAVLTVYIFEKAGAAYRKVTSMAIDFMHDGEAAEAGMERPKIEGLHISPLMGVAAFVTAALSHFSGASVGKEGAGVQIGLATGELLYRADRKIFKGTYKSRGDYYLICGASAAFGALFGSPIAGCLFGLTFATPDLIRLNAILPAAVASFAAVWFSSLLGIHVMEIPEFEILPFTWENALAVAIFAIVIGIAARFFILLLEEFKENVKEGKSTFKGEEKYRVMFEGIACWPHLRHTFKTLKDAGVNVTGTVYADAFGYIYNNTNELMQAYCRTPNAINFERSADMRLKVLRENNCDGAIIHINRSCKQWSGQMYELERVIREETGIPTAVFDGDQADPRNFSEAQYDTRIQGLVEVMAANKEAK